MGEILTFTPRLKQAAPEFPGPVSPMDLRAEIEAGAQAALDMADRFIAILDRLDGEADHEDGGDAEPSLAAPENATCSQVVWMRGNDADREMEAPEAVLPEVRTEATVIEVEPLRWGGHGNVVAAAGSLLIDLLERA
ncbi:hypothetical protein [Methylobacterium sp. E-046]|uniref:hypothetical protein n=1 Tax=Methylobacterium sp. E-046 TaxID=2836576 RepID=UPI001FB8C25A|nr:hypothetical protein [Methylobacterium sp. E-046]MCJ2101849.1 hypothetical protein [Methylobacterium sp. E-046]